MRLISGKKKRTAASLVPVERIERIILLIRGQKVLLDRDLAELYDVPAKALNQAVKRNLNRFPEDFMFQLTKQELDNWRSQFVTSNPAAKMGVRRRPYAFTEQGVAMLSSVLRSERAIEVNIEIMRAFVRLRQLLSSHVELSRKLKALEQNTKTTTSRSQRSFKPSDSSWLDLGHRTSHASAFAHAEDKLPAPSSAKSAKVTGRGDSGSPRDTEMPHSTGKRLGFGHCRRRVEWSANRPRPAPRCALPRRRSSNRPIAPSAPGHHRLETLLSPQKRSLGASSKVPRSKSMFERRIFWPSAHSVASRFGHPFASRTRRRRGHSFAGRPRALPSR